MADEENKYIVVGDRIFNRTTKDEIKKDHPDYKALMKLLKAGEKN